MEGGGLAVIFYAYTVEDGSIQFEYADQQQRYCKAKFGVGACLDVEIREHREKRSDRQNRALHALLAPWAKERGWNPDHLKLKMLEIAFGTIETTEPLTGKIVLMPAEPHSSHLNVTQFCHLIEEVLRVSAEDGYWLEAPDEYRLAKEKRDKKAAKAA